MLRYVQNLELSKVKQCFKSNNLLSSPSIQKVFIVDQYLFLIVIYAEITFKKNLYTTTHIFKGFFFPSLRLQTKKEERTT